MGHQNECKWIKITQNEWNYQKWREDSCPKWNKWTKMNHKNEWKWIEVTENNSKVTYKLNQNESNVSKSNIKMNKNGSKSLKIIRNYRK